MKYLRIIAKYWPYWRMDWDDCIFSAIIYSSCLMWLCLSFWAPLPFGFRAFLCASAIVLAAQHALTLLIYKTLMGNIMRQQRLLRRMKAAAAGNNRKAWELNYAKVKACMAEAEIMQGLRDWVYPPAMRKFFTALVRKYWPRG